MADALVHRGVQVTLVSRTEAVLATFDPAYGKLSKPSCRNMGSKFGIALKPSRFALT